MLSVVECVGGVSAAAAVGRQDSEAAAAAVEWEDSTGVSAPLYEVVDVIFELGSRGFFRRQVPLPHLSPIPTCLHMRSGTRPGAPSVAAPLQPLPFSRSRLPPSAGRLPCNLPEGLEPHQYVRRLVHCHAQRCSTRSTADSSEYSAGSVPAHDLFFSH